MKSEWISVDDRLPDINQAVLTYDDCLYRYPFECFVDVCVFRGEYSHNVWNDKEMKMMLSEADRWVLFQNIETGNTRNYTHWMPLPEPPNGE